MTAKALRAVFPGSFDPLTNGHLDLVERGLRVFSELFIVVATSVHKRSIFDVPERVTLIQECTKKYGARVQVEAWDGLTVDFLKKNDCKLILRGLRPTSDFEAEFSMATMNRELAPEVETILMVADPGLTFVSSSMVREVALFGGDVSRYVPAPVARALVKRFGGKKK